MKRIFFYALRGDILSVLERMEASRSIRYVDLSDYKTETPREWSHGRDIPSLGTATHETGRNGDRFLIVEAGANIYHSPTIQRDGTKRYDIYSVNNPESIMFVPGGAWGKGIILAGEFVTMSTAPLAKALMRSAYLGIRESFKKVNGYWVGPEALARLRSGARLTIAEQSPSKFDLKESITTEQEEGDGLSQQEPTTNSQAEFTVISMDEFRKMFGGT